MHISEIVESVEERPTRLRSYRGSPYITKHIPEHRKRIPCYGYYVLHHGYGCPYMCRYCYLLSVMRKNVYPTSYSDLDRIEYEVKQWLTIPNPAVLHTGSLSDPFSLGTDYLKRILPLFVGSKHRLFILSKGVFKRDMLSSILSHPPIPNVTVC